MSHKAPADSATRTPIHPTKRSSEDGCIVSGNSIADEGTPAEWVALDDDLSPIALELGVDPGCLERVERLPADKLVGR